MCLNAYDIRLMDEYPACGMNWPIDLKDITPYLRVLNPSLDQARIADPCSTAP